MCPDSAILVFPTRRFVYEGTDGRFCTVLKRQEGLQAKQRAVDSKLRISTGPIDQTPNHTSSTAIGNLADMRDEETKDISC